MNRFNRKFTLLILLLIVVLLSLYSNSVRTLFTALTSSLRSAYIDAAESLKRGVDHHLFQAERIERLQKEIDELEKRVTLCRSDAAMYRYIEKALEIGAVVTDADLRAVRPEGYAMIGNFQQLWLESFENYDPMRNYGVIRDGYAVGIVVEKELRPLMILAGDPECTFAVYIGSDRAPGIAMGSDERHMVVKYIPQWLTLKPGDEVSTSGLDHIFPPGIPVGRVLYTRKMQGFQNAYIELYGDTLHPDLVWVVSAGNNTVESDS
ncbi:rod shape-determining protein MreC [Hydrogenimonas sp.]|nr:rod shape-determining protein MreC [Hydrogenimonas sp.]